MCSWYMRGCCLSTELCHIPQAGTAYGVAIITSSEVGRLSALCSFPQGCEVNSLGRDINIKQSEGLKRVWDSISLWIFFTSEVVMK